MKDIELKNKSFLDIGFGQGIPLLIAFEMGARVTGCDINPKCEESLAITARQFGVNPSFPVVIGSILSQETVNKLQEKNCGKFDIVHSWGVLHHTGDMARSIITACNLLKITDVLSLRSITNTGQALSGER